MLRHLALIKFSRSHTNPGPCQGGGFLRKKFLLMQKLNAKKWYAKLIKCILLMHEMVKQQKFKIPPHFIHIYQLQSDISLATDHTCGGGFIRSVLKLWP